MIINQRHSFRFSHFRFGSHIDSRARIILIPAQFLARLFCSDVGGGHRVRANHIDSRAFQHRMALVSHGFSH